MKTQAHRLDRAYLAEDSPALDVEALLARALAEATARDAREGVRPRPSRMLKSGHGHHNADLMAVLRAREAAETIKLVKK